MNLEETDTRYKQLIKSLRKSSDKPEDIVKEFETERWNFPPCFSFKMQEEFVDSVRLPFHERIGGKAGGQGSILRVLIHEDFVSDELKKELGESALKIDNAGNCYRLAVKVYQKHQEELYEREADAYTGLTNVPGMVKYLGRYAHHDGHGQRTFNILLEMGDMDLWDCFSNEYNPVLLSDITKFWQAIYKIAKVIYSIHELDHRGDHYFGWHGDVKPGNILLVGPDLKLVDCGFTKFKKDRGEAKISHYLNKGNNTYSAPELARPKFVTSDVRLAQLIDIWSFGCVMSVAATWIVLGSQGVKQYTILRASARKKLNPAQGNDAFHDGGNILPEIKHWHSFLNDHKRVNDSFTPKILSLIESGLLRGKPEERLSSKELCNELGSIIQCLQYSIEETHSQQPAFSVLTALAAKQPATVIRVKSNESNSQARTSSETKRSSASSETQSQPTSTSWTDSEDRSLTRESSIQPVTVDERLKRKPLPPRPQSSENTDPRDSSSQSRPMTTTETGSSYTSIPHPPPSHRELTISFHQSTEESFQTPAQLQHSQDRIWEALKHKNDPGNIYYDVCCQILANYPKIGESINDDGLTPIMEAVKEDNTRIVRLLLDVSPLTKTDAERKTVLHYVVLKTKHETSELIRDMAKIARRKYPGSEFINAFDTNHASPLYYCVDIGNLKTATTLLELGAKINSLDGSQRSHDDVFVHAAQSENKEMLRLFMEKGAKYNLDSLRKTVPKRIISYIQNTERQIRRQ